MKEEKHLPSGACFLYKMRSSRIYVENFVMYAYSERGNNLQRIIKKYEKGLILPYSYDTMLYGNLPPSGWGNIRLLGNFLKTKKGD